MRSQWALFRESGVQESGGQQLLRWTQQKPDPAHVWLDAAITRLLDNRRDRLSDSGVFADPVWSLAHGGASAYFLKNPLIVPTPARPPGAQGQGLRSGRVRLDARPLRPRRRRGGVQPRQQEHRLTARRRYAGHSENRPARAVSQRASD